MNINPENVCAGSGLGFSTRGGGRTSCFSCGRSGIRVRVNGALFKHSKKGKR